MTEEEKEAIEFVKNLIETIKQSKMLFNEDITAVLGKATYNNLNTILNLIQKQQVEIEKKDKESHLIQSKLDVSDAKIIELTKIIDEMFEEYEYSERINIKDFCDEELRKDTCIQDCEVCIKQYFERKVNI